jgi:hypothetical protein
MKVFRKTPRYPRDKRRRARMLAMGSAGRQLFAGSAFTYP